jgi:hypothetical protein
MSDDSDDATVKQLEDVRRAGAELDRLLRAGELAKDVWQAARKPLLIQQRELEAKLPAPIPEQRPRPATGPTRPSVANVGPRQAWDMLTHARTVAVKHHLEEGERVEDHGLMRFRLTKDGEPPDRPIRGKWHKGFMVLTDRRLLWQSETNAEMTYSVLFSGIHRYKGFTKIVTADLYVETSDYRLRFNGGKTFVFLCCRALGMAGIPAA